MLHVSHCQIGIQQKKFCKVKIFENTLGNFIFGKSANTACSLAAHELLERQFSLLAYTLT